MFIDPTDTGFSHTLPGASPSVFHSVDSDSEAIAQLIALWLRDHHRMPSPKYVFGESYGSMRAVALSRDLARLPENPAMRLLLTQGRYDTLTQMGITEYTLMQADLPLDHVTNVYYDGGHFLVPTSEAMAGLCAFVTGKTPTQ